MWCNICGSQKMRSAQPTWVRQWNKQHPGKVRRIRFCEVCFNCFATEETSTMCEELADIDCMDITNTYAYETCVHRLRKQFNGGELAAVVTTEEVVLDCKTCVITS